jgi:hypothetical protein
MRRFSKPDANPRHATVALLAGLVLLAIALAGTLTASPSRVIATNAVPVIGSFAATEGAMTACQGGETLPRGTSAIRLWLAAVVGPRVGISVLSHGRLLTSGTRGSGWTARTVTVPVRALSQAASNTTDCVTIARSRLSVGLLGKPLDQAPGAGSRRTLPGRIRIEYMGAGNRSWWSQAGSIAARMGLGRAPSGAWAPAGVLVLVALIALLALRLAIRELGAGGRAAPGARARTGKVRPALSRVPAAAWTCALVACLNAVCWSLLTPPFQVPDEPDHFAYVQLLAVNGQLPVADLEYPSPEEQVALRDLHFEEVRGTPPVRAISSEEQQRTLERDLAASPDPRGLGGAGNATSEPPLYYALEVIPYDLASGASLLDRLELMRLLSALMAGVTALFAYLFLREALPGRRWAWTVGGLAVALFPLLGSISGGVNPDAMLCAVCAALYYCLARAFHRGLTRRLALVTAVLTAIGFATKLDFLGFAPGVLGGLLVLSLAAARRRPTGSSDLESTRSRWSGASVALAAAALVYVLVHLSSGHTVLGAASGAIEDVKASPSRVASYVWQFYLPRLPGMFTYFPALDTARQVWFDRLVGLYGWDDTVFPIWVYDVALIAAAAIVALACRELIGRRRALRERVPQIAIYAVTAAGVMTVLATRSYISDVLDHEEPYWEPRFLLPLLCLWGLVAALAARGAGRRWGPPVGVLLIVLFLAHDLFSQLQVIARFYG